MDYDRVIVLDKGKVKEFDSPHELLKKRVGVFSKMVDATGKESSKALREVAKKSFMVSNPIIIETDENEEN